MEHGTEQADRERQGFPAGGGRRGDPRLREEPLASSPSRSTSSSSSRDPRGQARNAAQYPHDVLDHFGTEQVQHLRGADPALQALRPGRRRADGRVAGQEEVQNALYRLLGNFVRAGRVNKLILLHGPNGSAKSHPRERAQGGMEHYSRSPRARSTGSRWVFPSEKLVKGSIGFGESAQRGGGGELTTFAHLDGEAMDVRLQCELRDHPLFVVPRAERQRLLERALARAAGGRGRRTSSSPTTSLDGELCHKCRRIYNALLAAYKRRLPQGAAPRAGGALLHLAAATRWARSRWSRS